MTTAASVRNLVNEARDIAGFDHVANGLLVLCGTSPLLEILFDQTRSDFDVINLGTTPPSEIATHANANNAAVVLSFQQNDELNGIHLHYWASYKAHSRRGEQLASTIATSLSRSPALPRVEVTGMALPILRETRMTTLQIEHGSLDLDALQEFSKSIIRVLDGIIHN